MTWQDDALCATTDPDAFFPEKDGSAARAKKICGQCDVVAECLAYALSRNEQFGIWGNTSPKERQLMRREAA